MRPAIVVEPEVFTQFRTDGDGPTIDFIAGAVALTVCMLFIDPIIGWFVSFTVSITLTWLIRTRASNTKKPPLAGRPSSTQLRRRQ